MKAPELEIIFPSGKWTMSFPYNVLVIHNVVKAPCLFHRIMQRLILGIKWEKSRE